jgi:hypothetical protein
MRSDAAADLPSKEGISRSGVRNFDEPRTGNWTTRVVLDSFSE